jgi:hypothetical protein
MTNVISVPISWQELNDVITFSLTSQGWTGEEWIEYFNTKNIQTGVCTKALLLSESFKSIKGKTYQIGIIKGDCISYKHRFTSRVLQEARERKFGKLNLEVGCLMRYFFTDEEIKSMGISSVVVMHKPVVHFRNPTLLCVTSYDNIPCLKSYYGATNRYWKPKTGFAFAA